MGRSAKDIESDLKKHGISLDIKYSIDGPSRERILQQIALNGSIYGPISAAELFKKDKVDLYVIDFDGTPSAKYHLPFLASEFATAVNNMESNLHSFRLAGPRDELTLHSEIDRYGIHLRDRILPELAIDPKDKNDPLIHPAHLASVLPVKEYSLDELVLTNPDLQNAKKSDDNSVSIPFDAAISLSSHPIGRNYKQEVEYFEREVLPLLKKATSTDVAKAITVFKSALHARFPTQGHLNYHQGQLNATVLALDDLVSHRFSRGNSLIL